MNSLMRWLQQQAIRERRTVYLEDAILGSRFWRYALYRLRLFFPRFAAELALHLIRVILLFQIFSQNEFILVLPLHAAAGLVSSFWWGSLEVMRERVRDLYRSGKMRIVPKEIGRWLSLSLQLGIIILAATFLIATSLFYTGQALTVFNLYVFSIFFALALDLVTRCYHSGIYSLRRIYRPAVSVLIIEMISFLAVLLSWPWIGAWSFPAAYMVSTLVATVVTFHYTRRMYRFMDFEPVQYVDIKKVLNPIRGSTRQWLGSGFSNVVMSLDSIIILALFPVGIASSRITALFRFFFIVSPIIRGGADWARLFYFDLKRLEIKPFINLRRRFEASVIKLAVLLGFAFWGLASLISSLFYQQNFELYLLIMLFFLSHSLLAATQMEAFTEEAYGTVLKSGLFITAGIASLNILSLTDQGGIALISILSSIAMVLLLHRQRGYGKGARLGQVLWPIEWLDKVRRIESPIQISAFKVTARQAESWSERTGSRRGDRVWRERHIAEKTARRLRDLGRVTLIYPNRIVWYEQADYHPRIDEEWLASELGGLIESVENSGTRKNGSQCLEASCAMGLLGEDFREAFNGAGGLRHTAEIREAFIRLHPRGIIYDTGRPTPAELEEIPAREKRSIIHAAISFARDFKSFGRKSLYDVTALFMEGNLRMIFLVERKTDRRARSRWRELVKQFNLAAALGSVEK